MVPVPEFGGSKLSIRSGMKNLKKNFQLSQKVNHRNKREKTADVIFFGISDLGLRVNGKVSPEKYLPAFCDVLRENGINTHFSTSVSHLKLVMRGKGPKILVLIYGEEGDVEVGERLEASIERADLIYNRPDMGWLIANKKRANEYLSGCGIKMPQMVAGKAAPFEVFSNAMAASGADVFLVDQGGNVDDGRYNAQMIDTRQEVDGRTYFVSPRLMCVSDRITNVLVRARPVEEGSPSVHSKNTPLDAGLLAQLHERLVSANMETFREMAGNIARAIGPGFYSHDLLIERETGEVFLAEAGYKFDDATYCKHVAAIVDDLPWMAGFTHAEETARNAAQVFIRDLRERLADGPSAMPRAIREAAR